MPTIRAYIKEHRIDRQFDSKMLTYNKVWHRYYKDSDQSIASIAKTLKLSENTIKEYLKSEKPQFKVADGKVANVGVSEDIEKLREELIDAVKRFPRVKKIQENHPEYGLNDILRSMPLVNSEKNRYQVGSFMQMQAFDADIKKGYYKFKDMKIQYIKN